MAIEKITTGKVRFHGVVDIPAVIEPIAELRRVMHEVLEKYETYNLTFDETDPFKFLDADQRHLNKMKLDPFALDDESGCPHIWHKLFNMMVLEIQRRRRVERDELDEYVAIDVRKSDQWSKSDVIRLSEQGERFLSEPPVKPYTQARNEKMFRELTNTWEHESVTVAELMDQAHNINREFVLIGLGPLPFDEAECLVKTITSKPAVSINVDERVEDGFIRRVRPVLPLSINGTTLYIGDTYHLHKNKITDINNKTVCEKYNSYNLQEILCNSELL